MQAFDGDLAVQAGDHDLAITGLALLADAHQVTVEDTVIDHGVAAHLEQVVRGTSEQAGVNQQLLVNAQVGANRRACSYLAQHGHFENFRAAQGCGQADAPCLVGRDVDVAGLTQGGDVLARNAT
ncbi:hypothetical protein D3C81_1766170 [compost metagenome]